MHVEGFEPEAIAVILDADRASIAALSAEGEEFADGAEVDTVLIIEDEPQEASWLKELMTALGHRVVGVAKTHGEAVKLARSERPALVLTSVMRADGSSGVEAAQEILEYLEIPVVLISAFIEGHLKGDKPAPAFAISKPYKAETVKAIVGLALLIERARRAH